MNEENVKYGYVKIEIPKNCNGCVLCGCYNKTEKRAQNTPYCRGIWPIELGHSNELLDYPKKPDWCPIKELDSPK